MHFFNPVDRMPLVEVGRPAHQRRRARRLGVRAGSADAGHRARARLSGQPAARLLLRRKRSGSDRATASRDRPRDAHSGHADGPLRLADGQVNVSAKSRVLHDAFGDAARFGWLDRSPGAAGSA
jgi:hypothetical protein